MEELKGKKEKSWDKAFKSHHSGSELHCRFATRRASDLISRMMVVVAMRTLHG
jgi:hypothetical protein